MTNQPADLTNESNGDSTNEAVEQVPRPLRIAAIDDHTTTRLAMPHLLPGHTVTTWPDAQGFLAARPVADVVLLDLDLAGTHDYAPLTAGQALKAITAAGYPVLIYTNERRRHVLAACIALGASGVIHKAEPPETLHDAITTVHHGGIVITTALSGLAEAYARRDDFPQLTQRQHEVLALTARGRKPTHIALQLHIARRTAEDHITNINKKFADYLQTHSPADLERHLGTGHNDHLDWRTTPPPKPPRKPRARRGVPAAETPRTLRKSRA